MNPYELFLHLRDNKLLYRYLEVGAVSVDSEEKWSILGESDYGEAIITELSTGVLRFLLPVRIDMRIPPQALAKLLSGIQENTEGILQFDIQEDGPVVLYSMHTTLEGLDEGLAKFVAERNIIRDAVSGLMKTMIEMQESMRGLESLKDKPPVSKRTGKPEPNTDSLWSVLEEIDKAPEETTSNFPPIEPEELGEALEDDEVDFNPPRPFDEDDDDGHEGVPL